MPSVMFLNHLLTVFHGLNLQSLYQPEYLGLKFTDLLTVCELVEIQVTAEMADMVEKETRKQSNCKLWFKY